MRHRLAGIVAAAAFVAALMPALASQLPFLPQQGPPADPNLRFDVASVKTADPSLGGGMMMRMTPGSFEATGVPLRLLLRQALQKPDYQIVGAPAWVDSERYTVAAKAGAGAPPGAVPVMMVNLLKDRFQMASHMETRELAIFHLVVARADRRLGANLKESSADCQAMIAARAAGAGAPAPGGGPVAGPPGAVAGGAAGRGAAPGGLPGFDPNAPIACGSMRTGPGMLGAGGRAIAQLVQMLSNSTGRPVVDGTGLTGLYDFSLRFTPEPGSFPLGAPPPGVLPPPDPDAPNLYTAIQEQLGLKMENARGPVEVVVIDRLEKPTPD